MVIRLISILWTLLARARTFQTFVYMKKVTYSRFYITSPPLCIPAPVLAQKFGRWPRAINNLSIGAVCTDGPPPSELATLFVNAISSLLWGWAITWCVNTDIRWTCQTQQHSCVSLNVWVSLPMWDMYYFNFNNNLEKKKYIQSKRRKRKTWG